MVATRSITKVANRVKRPDFCRNCQDQCIRTELRQGTLFLKYNSSNAMAATAEDEQEDQTPTASTETKSPQSIQPNINGLKYSDETPISTEGHQSSSTSGEDNKTPVPSSAKDEQKTDQSGPTKAVSAGIDATEDAAHAEAKASEEATQEVLEASSILLHLRYSDMPVKERQELITSMRVEYMSKYQAISNDNNIQSRKRKRAESTPTEDSECDTDSNPEKKIMLKLNFAARTIRAIC
ncbi:hypothetical protein AA313_de0202104 [Arthrobotrys entomopaga]|nr:hypothetical protein AA313_de0202104 [Arthrobotrys entomopaga]